MYSNIKGAAKNIWQVLNALCMWQKNLVFCHGYRVEWLHRSPVSLKQKTSQSGQAMQQTVLWSDEIKWKFWWIILKMWWKKKPAYQPKYTILKVTQFYPLVWNRHRARINKSSGEQLQKNIDLLERPSQSLRSKAYWNLRKDLKRALYRRSSCNLIDVGNFMEEEWNKLPDQSVLS